VEALDVGRKEVALAVVKKKKYTALI